MSKPKPIFCPKCGVSVAAEATGGLCPRCLVERALVPDDPSGAGPEAAPVLGSIGGYDVIEEIARGGMGVVYKAHQPSLNRLVALKVLSEGAAGTPEARRRFEIEAEAVAGLEHPNIVPVYETGFEDGHAYYSMKLVEGETLGARLGGKAMEGREAALLLKTIAGAVHYAHQRGVLHRDLKPQNILIDGKGEPHLTDFGLAKVTGQDTGLTLSGAILGTPAYMSPEQADGGTRDLTTPSDVYSLGAVFYEMLTGKPPHAGNSVMGILKSVVENEPAPPRSLDPGIDGDLETIALKCLEKDPARRYASAQGLVDDLERWRRGEPIAARPASTIERMQKWTRRRPMHAAAAGLAVLFLLTLGVGGPLVALRQSTLREEADAARAVAEERERETREALARSALSLAEAALREGNGQAMREALDTVPEPLRDSTWRYLRGQSDTSLPALRENSDVVPLPTSGAIAADSSRPGVFAVGAAADLSVVVVDVRGGRRLLEFTPEFETEAPEQDTEIRLSMAFSPDGERIAVGRSGKSKGIVFHSARDGRKLAHWDAPSTSALEYSPDGKRLLQSTAEHSEPWWHLEMRDAATGRVLWKYNPEASPQSAAFTADGKQVLTSGPVGELRLLDARDGTVVRSFPDQVNRQERLNVYCRVLGASGLIAQSLTDNTILVSDLKTGGLVTRFQHPKAKWAVRGLVFSPDGEQLVTSTGMPDGREILNVWNARTGFLARPLLGGRSERLAMAVHPLSGEFFMCGDYPRAWDLTGVPPRWVIPNTSGGELAFWGDDDTVMAPRPSGGLGVVSLESGEPSPRWPPAGARIGGNRCPHVSADGRRAAIPGASGSDTVIILERNGRRIEEKKRLNGPPEMWNGARARLNPDGRQAVVFWTTLSDSPLHWFSCETGEIAGEMERRNITEIHDLGWLSENRLVGLVTTGGLRTSVDSSEQVVLWDMTAGKILRTARHTTDMNALAPEPGGGRFAEAGADKNVRIRDAETLEVLHEFRVHDGAVERLAWHPSRPILATTAADWTYRIWNVDTGEMLEEMRGPLSLATSLAFSPSGRRLGATDIRGTVRIWEPRSLAGEPEREKPSRPADPPAPLAQ